MGKVTVNRTVRKNPEFPVILGQDVIIMDDVMLLAGPEGSVTVSSKDIVVIRDVRCTMDKIEVCVDVDVK